MAADPVVAAGMAAHGRDAANADWRELGQGPEVAYPAMGGRPNVHVDGGYAYVRWWRADGRTPQYEVTAGTPWRRSLRIPDMDPPDTIILAMTGRPLGDIIDVPGGDGLVITAVHVEKLGEYRHTVLTLGFTED